MDFIKALCVLIFVIFGHIVAAALILKLFDAGRWLLELVGW